MKIPSPIFDPFNGKYNLFLEPNKYKKNIFNSSKVLTWNKVDNSFYKCSMKIVSGGQIYNSKTAWKFNQPGDHNQVIDCEEFWEDLNLLRIYNKN